MHTPIRGAHMPKTLSVVVIFTGALLPYTTNAHHSYAPYDDTQVVELDGTMVDVSWQNPHVHFKVETVEADQRRVTWDIETVGLNQLQRLQVPLEVYKPGQRVKVAGWLSRQQPSARMY